MFSKKIIKVTYYNYIYMVTFLLNQWFYSVYSWFQECCQMNVNIVFLIYTRPTCMYNECNLNDSRSCISMLGVSIWIPCLLFFDSILEEEEVEDTKVVIRIRISKKNRQHNGQKKKYKGTNNDLQSIHIKLKIE